MKVQLSNGRYSAQHVTGPKCVSVAISFGGTTENEPVIVALEPGGGTGLLDVASYIEEVLAGVERANLELGGSLNVREIAYVPDDYPGRGQAEHVAYNIARAVLRNEI